MECVTTAARAGPAAVALEAGVARWRGGGGRGLSFDPISGFGNARNAENALAGAAASGRRVIASKHSTDVDSPPPPPRVYMSIHPEGKSSSDLDLSACSQ